MNISRLKEKTSVFRSYSQTALFLGKSIYRGEDKKKENLSFSKITETNIVYDLYEPEKPAGKTFIIVHGLTLQGNKDARLIHFAQTLSDFGVRAVAIFLPALANCRFEEKDVIAIQELSKTLSQKYKSKIGIIAFSFGAGLSLVAASEKSGASIINPLILFGAYFDLSDVFRHIFDRIKTQPADEKSWDNHIWFKLVLAYRNLDDIPLSSEKKKDLETLLLNYCHETSMERKQMFYKNVLESIDYSELENKKFVNEIFERISPANYLENIESDVVLLHDYFDDLVDPYHSERIFKEISKQNKKHNHKILVTPLLSHVTPRMFFKVFDIFRLIGIMSVIFKPLKEH